MATAHSALDIVKQLIAFDTTSRNSNLALIAFAQGILERAGARVRLTHDESGQKANLFATLGPQGDRGYVLSGHTDVVPVDGQQWSSEPFAAVERDGRLYGRGTADMKGFVGVALALAPEFARAKLKRPLHFAFSYDEETGCAGVRRLLDDVKAAGIKPELAVIGEPTEMRVAGAHKGGAVIETIARGREGHSSAPERGANAVMMAGAFIGCLQALGEELKGDKDTRFDPPYSTVQANMVAGGTAVNVLAREAVVTWEYRSLPKHDGAAIVGRAQARAEEIVKEFRANAPEARFETKVPASYPALDTEADSPAVRLALSLAGQNEVHALAFGTEAGFFQAAGIPAVVCGPGSINQAHRADEYIALTQLAACERFLRRLAERATRD